MGLLKRVLGLFAVRVGVLMFCLQPSADRAVTLAAIQTEGSGLWLMELSTDKFQLITPDFPSYYLIDPPYLVTLRHEQSITTCILAGTSAQPLLRKPYGRAIPQEQDSWIHPARRDVITRF